MKKSTRLLAVFLAVVMLFGILPTSIFASDVQPDDSLIQTFKAKIVSGATKNAAGDYVWTPDGTQGHMFIYRVTYAFSGIGEFEAGAIEMRVPKTILEDRSGNKADSYDISLPEAGTQDLPDTAYFVYTVDGNDTGREVQVAIYDPDRIRQPCAGSATCASTQSKCADGAANAYKRQRCGDTTHK